MLTFEIYITHYRKYRDVKRLSVLQELVWAYEDAFGTAPKTLTDLESVGLSTLTGTILSDYAIDVDLVQEKHVGSLRSLKTLPEANYDLSNISRQEIEDYKVNVLKYRDTWRASLDPMGIVLNRYGDGIQVDFFMTPIPSFGGSSDMQFYQKFFQ